MTRPNSDPHYGAYVRGQIQSLTEALTKVMFGDFTAIARTKEPDDDFGYLCVMINVAINAARNANDELRRANEELRRLGGNLERLVEQRTAELRSANQELEAFTYSASHDLRAPLRAINGYAQILLQDHGQALDEEGKRKLANIIEVARKMGDLIDDLLEFSRVGHAAVRRSAFDMAGLVQDVVAEALASCPERRIEVSMGELPAASGDRAMLRQLWVNLIGNAIKFTRPRAQPKIEIGGSSRAGEDAYWIKDNGVGFQMEYAHKIFGVFQRLHSAKEFEGTGVGLALVQRIVSRHGGRVWAQGEPGKGATFSFTLPTCASS